MQSGGRPARWRGRTTRSKTMKRQAHGSRSRPSASWRAAGASGGGGKFPRPDPWDAVGATWFEGLRSVRRGQARSKLRMWASRIAVRSIFLTGGAAAPRTPRRVAPLPCRPCGPPGLRWRPPPAAGMILLTGPRRVERGPAHNLPRGPLAGGQGGGATRRGPDPLVVGRSGSPDEVHRGCGRTGGRPGARHGAGQQPEASLA